MDSGDFERQRRPSSFNDFREDFQRLYNPRVFLMTIGILVLLWLASGIYKVGPGEQGVVRQFGREHSHTGPGLHYRLPVPIQTHDLVDVSRVRRIEVGFRGEGGRFRVVDREALMLTGDENIVRTQLIVQYVIKNASDFLFRTRDPEHILMTASEVALRSVVGNNTIDFTMTDGRFQVQEQVKHYLQRLLDEYSTGLLVQEARLLEVDAPTEVEDAFHDVVRAWEDRERLLQEAKGFAEDIIPRTRGQAAEVVRSAEAYKEQRMIRAQGEANRFKEVYQAYKQAPRVTRERLYLETIERVLPEAEKIVLPAGGNGVVPWLPLRDVVPPPAQSSQGGQS